MRRILLAALLALGCAGVVTVACSSRSDTAADKLKGVTPGPTAPLPSTFQVAKLCASGHATQASPCLGWDTVLNAVGHDYVAEFSPGYYQLAESVPLSTGVAVTIKGGGFGNTFITTSPTHVGNGIENKFAINGSYRSDLHISDIAIVNNNPNNVSRSMGLYQLDGTYVYVDHVRFSGWWAGLVFDQTEVSFVDDCDFEEPALTAAIASATSVTVTPAGTPPGDAGVGGSTYYVYDVESVSAGGTTSFAAPAHTAAGAAVLSATRYNDIAWVASAGADHYDIYRSSGGASLGKIGSTSSTDFHDTGLAGDATHARKRVRGIWYVDGSDVTPGVTPGFVNANWVNRTNFNGSVDQYHYVDDGGYMHVLTQSQFNGGAIAAWFAGVQTAVVRENYMEGQLVASTYWDYRSLDAQSGVGGNGPITFAGNFLSGTTGIATAGGNGPWKIGGNTFAVTKALDGSMLDLGGAVIESNLGSGTWPTGFGYNALLFEGPYGFCFHCQDPHTVGTWPDLHGGIEVNGNVAFRSTAITAINGTNDDLDIDHFSIGFQLKAGVYNEITGPTGAFTITSIATGFDGRLLVLYNTVAQKMTLANAAGTGTAANRILTPGGVDVTIQGPGSASLHYSLSKSRWILDSWGPVAVSGVTAETYNYATVTVGADGRITSASSGANPALASTTITCNGGLSGGGDLTTNRTCTLDMAHVNSFTKDQGTAIVMLTASGGHIVTDASLGNAFTVTLEVGGTDELDNPSNLLAGHTYQWDVIQPDGDAGVATLSYGTYFRWPAGVAPTATATLGRHDLISCLAITTARLQCAHEGDVR